MFTIQNQLDCPKCYWNRLNLNQLVLKFANLQITWINFKEPFTSKTEAILKESSVILVDPELREGEPFYSALRKAFPGIEFYSPFVDPAIKRNMIKWTKPITVARSSFGDYLEAQEIEVKKPGKAFVEFEGKRQQIHEFKTGGVVMSMFNDASKMKEFARTCFEFALAKEVPLYFTTKNTILKQFDGQFKNIFQEVYENGYEQVFKEAGLFYEHRLIDDMVAMMIKNDGGYVWAAKNYDGDVESSVVAAGFGGKSMMNSCLISGENLLISSRIDETAKEGIIGRVSALALAVEMAGRKEMNFAFSDVGEQLNESLSSVLAVGKTTAELKSSMVESKGVETVESFIESISKAMEEKRTGRPHKF